MKNRNFKQNKKPQKNSSPKVNVIPFVAEINIPTESDFVKIPVTVLTGLVANNVLLDAVKRYIAIDRYNYYDTLRTILGMANEKEEK